MKEPWEMTEKEWIESPQYKSEKSKLYGKYIPTTVRKKALEMHKKLIGQALAENKAIPQKVLVEYKKGGKQSMDETLVTEKYPRLVSEKIKPGTIIGTQEPGRFVEAENLHKWAYRRLELYPKLLNILKRLDDYWTVANQLDSPINEELDQIGILTHEIIKKASRLQD